MNDYLDKDFKIGDIEVSYENFKRLGISLEDWEIVCEQNPETGLVEAYLRYKYPIERYYQTYKIENEK